MGRSRLWSISWLCQQMFCPYITISASKSDNLRREMSPFSLFRSSFSGVQRILGHVRPRRIVAVQPPKRGKRRSICGLHLEELSNWDSLCEALWCNWPSNAPLKDADPELRHSRRDTDEGNEWPNSANSKGADRLKNTWRREELMKEMQSRCGGKAHSGNMIQQLQDTCGRPDADARRWTCFTSSAIFALMHSHKSFFFMVVLKSKKDISFPQKSLLECCFLVCLTFTNHCFCFHAFIFDVRHRCGNQTPLPPSVSLRISAGTF